MAVILTFKSRIDQSLACFNSDAISQHPVVNSAVFPSGGSASLQPFVFASISFRFSFTSIHKTMYGAAMDKRVPVL